MDNLYKKLLGNITLLLFFSLSVAFFPKESFADTRCETQYGGNEVCVTTGKLQVNKQIFCNSSLPGNEDKQICKDGFIDNMGLNFHKFAPGEEVRFRIIIKNTGDKTFSEVKVTDTPQSGFFELTSGSFNFTIKDLKPGETKDQEIKLKVLDSALIPQSNVVCVINSAEATSGGQSDKDTSLLCLGRNVLGAVTELPKTGPSASLFVFPLLVFGYLMTRAGKIGRKILPHYQYIERLTKKGRGC